MLIVIVAVFVLGLCIGSFINALVWRIHQSVIASEARAGQKSKGKSQKLSIWRGRSACPDCGHQLSSWDLVPVLSWIWLRGKCRYCKQPISLQYPIVELLTAGLFALSWYLMPMLSYFLMPINQSTVLIWVDLGVWLYMLTILIALSVYDLRWMILPDKLLLPAIAVALLSLVTKLLVGTSPMVILGPVLSALGVAGGFYLLAAMSRGRWLGGGDIKLVMLIGLLLGIQKTILAMFLAFNLAAIIGLVLIGLKLKSRKDHIPFGPFLALGAIISMLYGAQIIGWYLRISL